MFAESIRECNDLTDTKVSNQTDPQEDPSSKVSEEHSVEDRANDDNCVNLETPGPATNSGMVSIAEKGQKVKVSTTIQQFTANQKLRSHDHATVLFIKSFREVLIFTTIQFQSSRLEDTKDSWQIFLRYLGGEGTRERIEKMVSHY